MKRWVGQPVWQGVRGSQHPMRLLHSCSTPTAGEKVGSLQLGSLGRALRAATRNGGACRRVTAVTAPSPLCASVSPLGQITESRESRNLAEMPQQILPARHSTPQISDFVSHEGSREPTTWAVLLSPWLLISVSGTNANLKWPLTHWQRDSPQLATIHCPSLPGSA